MGGPSAIVFLEALTAQGSLALISLMCTMALVRESALGARAQLIVLLSALELLLAMLAPRFSSAKG